jgi:hypothetical protein
MPDNTPQSNRLLLELSSRLQKRAAAIADMAQSYNGGRLDSGFDRKVAAYDRANPMISDKEIPDFRKIINSGATRRLIGEGFKPGTRMTVGAADPSKAVG